MTLLSRLPAGAVAVCAVALALVLAACGADTPPPAKTAAAPVAAPAPAPAPAAPQSPDTEEKRLASEIWVWGFPLVLTDVTREVETADIGMNVFKHRRSVPDAATAGVANPNADFLYSQAWLDLSKGPVILSIPDTKGRYYLLALLDAYTNVAGSIGKRTTGTEARTFALVGPHYKGAAPEGASEVRLPTDLAWIFARTAVDGPADVANAIKVQDQFKLSGGAGKGAPAKGAAGKGAKGKAAPTPAAPAVAVDTKTPPRDQVVAMDATRFFTRLALLLPGNPPPKADAEIVAKLKKLGIEPGKPFNATQLDAAKQRSIDDGIRTAIAAVQGAAGGLGGADIRHGWRIDRALGRWGTEYGRRAVAAWNGIGQNAPEDAIFMSTYLDGGGKRLDGANRYVLHFAAGALPPTDGFWSLSLYDAQQKFVPNAKNRYNIGNSDRLQANADGSLDIVISPDPPGGAMDANWLPSPKAPFNLILRVYWPKQAVLDGHWNPPGVKLVAQ
ncbi:MAG: DUF1254 domain-containing protein [Burkholderiales bacterium]|nr:DUF1254 domain-containing protein [Burkholderiales bacterium]